MSLIGLCAAVVHPAPALGRRSARADRLTTPPLTLSQLAGEHVIFSYRGLTPPRSLLAAISAGKAAGVILFSSNISSRSQLRRVSARLQAAAARSSVKAPLLIMTDQEGGLVRRVPGPPAPSEQQIGQSADPGEQAKLAGRDGGANLRSVGVNVNLAPVLGVYRHAGDFLDQYGRSYGQNADLVGRLGADFIGSLQRTGVAATAKHFPGLGTATASQNTDEAPVTLELPLRELRATDEVPYRAAIRAGVKLIMVSWAVYPALDPKRPAGLSASVIQTELRRRLGFHGVTITDGLGAGALRPYGATRNRAILATAAGMDLLLCSNRHVDQGLAAEAGLVRGLQSKQLSRTDFTAATQRVLALRRTLIR